MDSATLQKIAPNLELVEDGWWRSKSLSNVSYPESGNEACFTAEDDSFWFRHRNECILEAIKRFPPTGAFFDVGGGNGYVSRALEEAGFETVLFEPGLAGARNAVKRGISQVVRATLEDAAVAPSTLPAVGLFDVLEHIPGDAEFLSEIHRLLIPEGKLFVTVPAYQWLWSGEDIQAGHARRYTLSTLATLFENAGFVIDFATYFFGFLPLPILIRRALPYRLGVRQIKLDESAIRRDHVPGSRFAARVLRMLTQRELRKIAAGKALRMGGSCLVVARKQSS